MPNFLESLAKRRKRDAAVEILWDVNRAFEQAGRQTIAQQSPRASDLQDLVRFCCDTDGIAPWLRNERAIVEKVLAFARKIGDRKVESILASALAGTPQPPVSFSISLPGQEPRKLNVDAGEASKFDGKDWGGTDIALSFAMEGLENALVDELIQAAGEIALAPPADERRKTKAKLSKAAANALQELTRHQVSALHLVEAEARTNFSKIGGCPNLPDSIAWPTWKGKSLAFIAQLNLEEVPARDGFDSRKTGRLYFFYDQGQSTWGYDPNHRGSWRVIYTLEPAPERESEPPGDFEEDARFSAKPIAFREIKVMPSAQNFFSSPFTSFHSSR